MRNIDVISIYRFRCEENIDMILILIFANIAIPIRDAIKMKWPGKLSKKILL